MHELDRYPWSGHSAVMGKKNNDWMDISYVLTQFGSRKNAARTAYRSFVMEGMKQCRLPYLTGGSLVRSKGGWSRVESASGAEYDERILGSGYFVNAVFKEIEEKTRLQLKLRRAGTTIGKIIDQECKGINISREKLKGDSRRRKVCVLRVQIAKRGLDVLGLSLAEIARHVGVSTSGIARAIKRLEEGAGK